MPEETFQTTLTRQVVSLSLDTGQQINLAIDKPTLHENQKSKIFPLYRVTVSNKVLYLTILSKQICLNEWYNVW